MVIPKPSKHPDSSLSHIPYPNWQQILPALFWTCIQNHTHHFTPTTAVQVNMSYPDSASALLEEQPDMTCPPLRPLTTLAHHSTSLLNLRVKSQVPSCLRQDPVWAGPSPLSSWLTPPQPCSSPVHQQALPVAGLHALLSLLGKPSHLSP